MSGRAESPLCWVGMWGGEGLFAAWGGGLRPPLLSPPAATPPNFFHPQTRRPKTIPKHSSASQSDLYRRSYRNYSFVADLCRFKRDSRAPTGGRIALFSEGTGDVSDARDDDAFPLFCAHSHHPSCLTTQQHSRTQPWRPSTPIIIPDLQKSSAATH